MLYVAFDKLTLSMLVNSLEYDNNFSHGEWNDDFRNNFNPPNIPPKEKSPFKEPNLLLEIHLLLPLLHIILLLLLI